MKITTLAGLSCWCPITIALILLNWPVLTRAFPVFNPQQIISGKVTGTDGLPIPGVNILIKSTPIGTVSGPEGSYVIEARDSDTLVFSYMGFKTIELSVNSRTVIDVQLEEEVTALAGVEVNAGYYTVKEREMTGSISRISAADIDKQPVSNPLAAMQGRMPGVNIVQNTGVPGGDFKIEIRGRNSIRTDGNAPLYVIDGVPFTATSLTDSRVPGANIITHPLNGINPADIESIEVLKDADATAIYGSRGANGVVLITTRKGASGKVRVRVDLQSGIGEVGHKMKLMHTGPYLDMRREAFANDGVEPTTANAPDLLLWNTDRYTNWQDRLIGGTAYITGMQASVSGGGEQTVFRFGGGYRKETTVYPGNSGNRKISGSFNLNHHSADKKFTAGLVANYTADNNSLPVNDLTLAALRLPPNAPEVYDADGKLNWEGATWNNPYAELERKYRNKTDNLVVNTNLGLRLLPGLELKTGLGYTAMEVKELQTTPQSAFGPPTVQNRRSSSLNNSSIRTWIAEPRIAYELHMGKATLKALLGGTFQETTRTNHVLEATGFSSDALLENIRAASAIFVFASGETQYRYRAVFGRINYAWNNTYFLNLTARRDGSSRFGPGRQWADFGALGFAWIFSEEDFFSKAFPFVSYGKLRGSYGLTGNDQIGDYQFLDLWQTTFFPYQGSSGLTPVRPFNPDFGWETNKKLEMAMELGFVKNRVQITAAYYRNRSSDQLIGLPLPGITGFTSVQANLPATVENTGWELELNTTNMRGKNFSWTTALHLSFPRNRLIAYPGIENSAHAHVYTVGKPLELVRSYQFNGVDPETGVYRFEDVNNDGFISWPDDIRDLEPITTKFFGGLQNSLQFGNWQLDAFFQVVKQTGREPYGSFSPPGFLTNQPEEVANRWRNTGDVEAIQRATQTFGPAFFAYNNAVSSDYAITDASFIRLKNLAVSYRLPVKHGVGVRFYGQGQNLLTITGYQGLDPENPGTVALPPLRVFTAGVELTF
ncbi:SusC/RagA family TonB-linked outer membrane protein [Sinomicrobium pectinilyticum]|uniref:SusC/RagA family TonB-linked outer membrane protein n=1 Tax=Sinomicrobium pectinilyticum TaxID=1084421 RepID=A0A3N0CZ06_SINP1|nr:SusC/RagA family TonB-linked outer membrane protein [Sinomicrobium pectinilyticum]RNL68638.1 SusC/RagA family TonB-linked outer membrane protein [Sinomicrobium pectinilyticum]